MLILIYIFDHSNVSWLCNFKNPTHFEMDWLSYCERKFPNHTSTFTLGGINTDHISFHILS